MKFLYHSKLRAKGCPGGCPGSKKGNNSTPRTKGGSFGTNKRGGGYTVPTKTTSTRKNGW